MEPLMNSIYLALLRFPLIDATEGRANSYKAQYASLASVPAGLSRETIPQLEGLRDDAARAWSEWKASRTGPFWSPIPSTDSKAALIGARLYAAYLVREWSLDASIRALETSTAPAASAPGRSSSSSKRPTPSAPSTKRPATPSTPPAPPSAPSAPPAPPAVPSAPPAPGLPTIETEESRDASAGGVVAALVVAGAFIWYMFKKKR